MHVACDNGYDEIVLVLLEHGVQVDVLDKVSDLSCIHVKLCKYWHLNVLNIIDVYTMEVTLAKLSYVTWQKLLKLLQPHWKFTKVISVYCHCSAIVVIIIYQ